jgi:pimeloyl-ACP methyl ester carboxylesterase
MVAECNAGRTPKRAFCQAGMWRCSYVDWGGTGDPVVLLHGITSSAQAWWQVAPPLVDQGYRVIAIDMPGHGQSATNDDHRIPALAALISAALTTLDLQRVTLIGHSWGGATSLALASDPVLATCLAQVVLVDPALRLTPEVGAERLAAGLEGVGQPPEVTKPLIERGNPDWHACDVSWKTDALRDCRASAVRGFWVASGDWDLSERCAAVAVPLLLMVCDAAYTVIPAPILAQAERSLRPGLGEIVHVPGTTHSMMRGPGFTPTMQVLSAWLNRQRVPHEGNHHE